MRISKITGTFLLFLVGMIQTVQAQEAIGLRTDRYLGINTALLNPANTVQFPLRWDANIVALDHFTATNYLYVKDIGLFSLLNNIENVRFANATDATPTQGTRIEADYYTGSHKRYAFTQTCFAPSHHSTFKRVNGEWRIEGLIVVMIITQIGCYVARTKVHSCIYKKAYVVSIVKNI